MGSKLLSICIPTYNGAERIIKTLECASDAIGERDDIEVVVSDNASTDNTYDILTNYAASRPFIRVYKNEKNLGFNCNMIKLIDEYASGQFCWVIGDDDYLDSDSINMITPLLLSEEADYICVNFRTLTKAQYERINLKKERDIRYIKGSYFECLDQSTSLGNILGTFMSAHIFRKNLVKTIDKSELKTDVWNTYETIFPNSYLMLEAFADNCNCFYVKNKVFTALDWKKNYSSKWVRVVDEVLPSAFDIIDLKCNGRHALKRSKLCLYDWGLRMNTIRLMQKDFRHISYQYFLTPKLFVCLFNHIKDKVDIMFNKNLL